MGSLDYYWGNSDEKKIPVGKASEAGAGIAWSLQSGL